MKIGPGVKRTKRSSAVPAVAETGPTLPAWKAFVVQFTREAGTGPGTFAGRVEHLSSGRRVRFASPAELVKTLERLLAEIGSEE